MRAQGAYDYAFKTAEELEYTETIEWLKECEVLAASVSGRKNTSLKGNNLLPSGKGLGGHLKNAFVLSFFHLLLFQGLLDEQLNEDHGLIDRICRPDKDTGERPNFFALALRQTVELGGDTDTNACIVGAMIGALVGKEAIPEYMIKKVLTFDCTKNGRKRPEFLSVRKHAISNIKKLLLCRPNDQTLKPKPPKKPEPNAKEEELKEAEWVDEVRVKMVNEPRMVGSGEQQPSDDTITKALLQEGDTGDVTERNAIPAGLNW